jgi:adenylate kinase family enzyme
MLGADDPLPRLPRRVLIAGTSGSGKTTLAARIGAAAGLPHVEIDGLYHGPNWTKIDGFEASVERFSAGDRWVTEWQYGAVRALLAERADTVVWLDHPRLLATYRVVRRTVTRRVRRTELWNGNREGPLWTFFVERDHIIRWSWRNHAKYAQLVGELARAGGGSPTVVRLSSQGQVERWLAGPFAAACEAAA